MENMVSLDPPMIILCFTMTMRYFYCKGIDACDTIDMTKCLEQYSFYLILTIRNVCSIDAASFNNGEKKRTKICDLSRKLTRIPSWRELLADQWSYFIYVA